MYIVSQNGLNIIKKFEGCVLHAYLDKVGVPTIGYGTTYYPNGKKVSINDPGITIDQATSYLEYNVNKVCIPLINNHVKVDLNQNQVDALCSFIYNEGSGGFTGSHLLVEVNASASYDIITIEFNKWVYANHKVLPDLIVRRAQEAKLYCS